MPEVSSTCHPLKMVMGSQFPYPLAPKHVAGRQLSHLLRFHQQKLVEMTETPISYMHIRLEELSFSLKLPL